MHIVINCVLSVSDNHHVVYEDIIVILAYYCFMHLPIKTTIMNSLDRVHKCICSQHSYSKSTNNIIISIPNL